MKKKENGFLAMYICLDYRINNKPEKAELEQIAKQ
jgi:hypothetical protein